MKYILLAGVLIFVLAGATTAAITTDPLKWSQLPDLRFGNDISSSSNVPSLVADDFSNTDGLPITDIHWWGSYWNSCGFGDTGGYGFNSIQPVTNAIGFELSIYSNSPGQQFPHIGYSHPDTLLWSYDVALADTNQTAFSQVLCEGKNLYSYDVYLPNNEVIDLNSMLETGKTYWLSIQAIFPRCDTTSRWGWRESSSDSLGGAVQQLMCGRWSPVGLGCFGTDMAFQLTTVPEPGGMVALSAGMVGLVGFVIRRRRV